MHQVTRASVIAVLMLACFGGGASADEEEAPTLAADPRVSDVLDVWTTWVEYQAGISRVPGVSLAVVHDQEVLRTVGIGFADPQSGIEAKPDTIYSICSNSKVFTAIGALKLRDQGKLRLDDTLVSHLDWLTLEDAHPEDEPITIRRVLTHSAGLPRESDYPYWSDPDFDFPTREQIIAKVGEQRTLYPSGRYFQYSNLGLTLIGEVVAEVSGMSYDGFIRSQILEPLEMVDTFTDIPAEHYGRRMAVGFSSRNHRGERQRLPLFATEGIAPAAGFASTAEDLARFLSWQFRLVGENPQTEILSPATLREMQRVHWVDPDWKTTWGLGFAVYRVEDYTVVGHGGGCPGYYSSVAAVPRDRLGFVVLTNAIGAEVGFWAQQGIQLIGPALKEAIDDPDGAPERDPELDRYVGLYRSAWGDDAVVRWADGLAVLPLRTRDPQEALTRLKLTGEHTFRRIRQDDESLGQEYVFEVDENGRATSFKTHSNWSIRRD
jgi:CubicO group peptidase (beta-lactamase class C family)